MKRFVKRQKNDAADAEAICEASQRPTDALRAAAVVFRACRLLVRQRTQIINALRGHLADVGLVVAKGPAHVPKIICAPLLHAVRPAFDVLIEELRWLDERIAVLDAGYEISRRAEEDKDARRLNTIPGHRPHHRGTISALAPPSQSFARGRNFAAWLGLTPLQRSSGGKQRLGKTSKMGERTLRRLLIIGASAVVRWAAASSPSGVHPLVQCRHQIMDASLVAASKRRNRTPLRGCG